MNNRRDADKVLEQAIEIKLLKETIENYRLTMHDQYEELQRLREQAKQSRVTGEEVAQMVNTTMFSGRPIQIAEWNRFLGDRGLLADGGTDGQTSPGIAQTDTTALHGVLANRPHRPDQETIYGVEVPKDIPKYEIIDPPDEDPLKVNMREQPQDWYEEMLARKHNDLVDEVRKNWQVGCACNKQITESVVNVTVTK